MTERSRFAARVRPRVGSRWPLVVLVAAVACGVYDWSGSYRFTAAGGAGVTDLTLSGAEPTLTIDHYGRTTTSPACEAFVSGCTAPVNTVFHTFGATSCPLQTNPPGCLAGAPATVNVSGALASDLSGLVTAIRVGDTKLNPTQVEVTRLSSDCTKDTDGDRIPDCYETNTGVYVSPTNTGTDPFNPDTDGDGISDGDEVLGTVGGLDLPGMGASPVHKNIFLEYDWFDDDAEPTVCGPHSHRPTQEIMDRVAQAFAAGPISNPDGTTGITLIQDWGQGGLFTGGNLVPDADGVIDEGVNGPTFQAIKAANFAPNRQGYFHYVLMPHRYDTNSGSSGQAELPGNDLIVSLYCYGTTTNVANTIMHELGHNLGLHHGGFQDCNYKPNYNSVMNYLYQFDGIDSNCTVPGNGVLSYSIGDRIDLDENNLDENRGTCGSTPWDWNGNSVIETGVAADLNAADTQEGLTCGGLQTVLKDWDDWANLSFTGLADTDFAPLAGKVVVDCDNPPPEARAHR